jgi:hypothetical protein
LKFGIAVELPAIRNSKYLPKKAGRKENLPAKTRWPYNQAPGSKAFQFH